MLKQNYRAAIKWCLVLVLLLANFGALAATHNLNAPNTPALCSGNPGSWSAGDSVYTCDWNQPFSIPAGDVVLSNRNITIVSPDGFNLNNVTFGGNGNTITLEAEGGNAVQLNNSILYGSISNTPGAILTGGTIVHGSVSVTGSFESDNATVVGSAHAGGTFTAANTDFLSQISSNGAMFLTNVNVAGNISASNGVTATNLIAQSTLTSTNGTVTLSGGHMMGHVNVSCCKVTVSDGAIIGAGITAGNNGIDISDSEVTGDLSAGNNPVVLTNVLMHSGNVSAGNNNVTISGGEINANIPNAHRVFITDSANVDGNIQARYEVNINNSTVSGDITTTDDHPEGLHGVWITDSEVTGDIQARYNVNLDSSALHGDITGPPGGNLDKVDLIDSEVYGAVIVRDDWGSITGNWPNSVIYGDCEYDTVTPQLCDDSVVVGVDHYRLSHSGELVSCFSETLQIRACLNEDCSQVYADDGEIEIAASQGTWLNASQVNGANATITLTSGEGQVNFNHPASGAVDFSFVDSVPYATADQPMQCFVNSFSGIEVPCSVLFKTAGLAFVDPNDIDQLDGSPIFAGAEFIKALRVVETNTVTGACEARVDSQTLPINLSYGCLNPGSCQANQEFSVDGQQISPSSPTAVPLSFNQYGVAEFGAGTYFTDVGQIGMMASATIPENSATGEPAVTISGNSLPFVSKPHTLRVFALNGDNSIRTMNQPDEPTFVAAGEPFSIIVASENALGDLTPNFGKESPSVAVNANFIETVYPVGGVTGTLTSGTSFTPSAIDGALIANSYAWSEVGSFTMRAGLIGDSYLGAGDVVNKPEDIVGRFFPYQFKITDSALTNSCNGQFTYLDEDAIGIDVRVEAQNSAGVLTQNYTNGYSDKASLAFYALSNSTDLSNRLMVPDLPVETWSQGELDYTTFSAQINKSASGVDGPWDDTSIAIGIESERDGINILVGGTPSSFLGGAARNLSGELNLLYGRLRLNNTFAPEGEKLQVSGMVEFWDGQRFVPNLEDSCTIVAPENLNITNNPSGLSLINGPAPTNQYSNVLNGEIIPNSIYWEPNTNSVGEFEFEYELDSIPWLQFNWTAAGLENPIALGTFGSFRGNDRVIYLLERRLN